MPRARNIKPGFFTNDDLGDLEPITRLLFIGLWTIADKDGRLLDRPRRIKALCLPYDQANVDSCLDQLWIKGFIHRYEVANNRYIQVVNWRRHQRPHHKESDSEIPPVPEDYQPPTQAQAKHEPSKAQASPPRQVQAALIPDTGYLIPEEKKKEAPNGAPTINSMWQIADSMGISRKIVGQQIKGNGGGEKGQTIVCEAIAKTWAARPADPRSYFLAILKRGPPASGGNGKLTRGMNAMKEAFGDDAFGDTGINGQPGDDVDAGKAARLLPGSG